MGEVVFGVDFGSCRERERAENEQKVVKALIEIMENARTDYEASAEDDPA